MQDSSERITISLVWREILELVSLEKGALRTTRDLGLQPSTTIHAYLAGNRKHLTNPLRYLIFSAALFAGLMIVAASVGTELVPAPRLAPDEISEVRASLIQADQSLAEVSALARSELQKEDKFNAALARQAREILNKTVTQRSMEVALTWTNVILVLAMPIYSLLTFLIFRKAKLNFAEHIVVNSFVLGFQNVLAVGMVIPGVFLGQALLSVVYMLFGLAYQTWAWRRVFGLSGWKDNLALAFVTVASIGGYLVVQALTTVALLWFDIEFS